MHAHHQIDGKPYHQDTLSAEARSQLASNQFCDAELARLKAQTAAFQTARRAYGKALQVALPAESWLPDGMIKLQS